MNDDEDVECCQDCLSLAIKDIGCNLPYCSECNGTNIIRLSFEEWEKKCLETKHDFRIVKPHKK